jgi:hypothetical protein
MASWINGTGIKFAANFKTFKVSFPASAVYSNVDGTKFD